VERFNLRELSKLEFRNKYHIKISNSSGSLENVSDSEDKYRGWEDIKENTKTSATESLGL